MRKSVADSLGPYASGYGEEAVDPSGRGSSSSVGQLTAATSGSYVAAPTGEGEESQPLLPKHSTPWKERLIASLWRLKNVTSAEFNAVIGVAVFANSIVIILETDQGHEHYRVVECWFNLFFLIELLLRVAQLRQDWPKDPWNLFDALLVTCSIINFMLEFVAAKAASSNTMATLRMLRVLRVFRLFRMFSELQMILGAFARALRVVMWLGILILILNSVCAIFLTQELGHNAHYWGEHEEEITKWFGSVTASMQSCFIIMTLSGWDEMAAVLIEVLPAPPVFLCFACYIMVSSYTMMSLITGVISESLVTAQQEDQHAKLQEIERQRQSLADDLTHLLNSLDTDGSGYLDSSEVEKAFNKRPELLNRLAALDVHVNMEGCLEMVEILSEDGRGVSIGIFVEALSNLSGHAKAFSIVDLKHHFGKRIEQLQAAHRAETASLREEVLDLKKAVLEMTAMMAKPGSPTARASEEKLAMETLRTSQDFKSEDQKEPKSIHTFWHRNRGSKRSKS